MESRFDGNILELLDCFLIYEEIEDRAEIAWTEHAPTTLRKLKQIVKTKGSFRQ